MNLHEFQGKAILRQFGVSVPLGIVAESQEAAVQAAREIQEKTGTTAWAIKAQIHAGRSGVKVEE